MLNGNIKYFLAQRDAEKLRERMEDGKRRAAQEGRLVHAGFGYVRDGAAVVVDAAAAACVRSIYRDVAAGIGWRAIAARLAGHAPPGAPSTARAVRQLVGNPLHAGCAVWGRKRTRVDRVTGARSVVRVPDGELVVARRLDLAIVDPGLFAAAFESRASGRRRRMAAEAPVVCGDDGAASEAVHAVGYVRVAGPEATGSSAARQVAAIGAHAAAIGACNPAIFQDLGASGVSLVDRPGLEAMIAATGPGSIVIVEDVDRLSRDVCGLMTVYDRLRRRGVRLHDTSRGCFDASALLSGRREGRLEDGGVGGDAGADR